ncbi:hypothetical protein K8353_37895 [Burkholderia contaminans]|uniref:hypothetical protein n=1 Tax=Burkholderia sp. D-99 TaxID=2717316 RepID=UPI0014226D49|nr:hypothetical protein [Burkholderia sp. D-99]MBZ5795907.1 hypothetical protein [Burkholderia contaminans]NHV28591.1 hypothetical protein [Burkholderia sp. D-99]
MTALPLLTSTDLDRLATRAPDSGHPCTCRGTVAAGWQSMPLSLPDTQLRDIGTLIDGDPEEASYAEFHPAGTRYWSETAPIAPRYFPYNRCTVSECVACSRVFLRYMEGGGYFVDRRIRALDANLIVDAPLGQHP